MTNKSVKKISEFLFFIILMIFVGSCEKYDISKGTFTDIRDGNVYKTVTIGDQIWMAENLRYLPVVTGPVSGATASNRYYVYGYEGTNVTEARATENYKTYGVLYNWVAAKAACPEGWHIPTDEEWAQLSEYLGGTGVGGKLKEKGTKHWNSPNTGATNIVGFAALPGGGRFSTFSFHYSGDQGFWWTASQDGTGLYYYRYIQQNDKEMLRGYVMMDAGFSVRCVKN
jgi:uncharacterized protein (TIGR02145 family)